MSDVSGSIISKIENWLTEEEFTHNRVEDKNADANISFWANPHYKLHAVVFKDRVTLVFSVLFNPDILPLVQSEGKTKEKFMSSLQSELYRHPCAFAFNNDEKTGELIGVRFSKAIWQESLTKTSFFDAIQIVLNCGHSFGIIQQELVSNLGA